MKSVSIAPWAQEHISVQGGISLGVNLVDVFMG